MSEKIRRMAIRTIDQAYQDRERLRALLRAIYARIRGEYDHEDLYWRGELSANPFEDITGWIEEELGIHLHHGDLEPPESTDDSISRDCLKSFDIDPGTERV